jgi:hypothetical protein
MYRQIFPIVILTGLSWFMLDGYYTTFNGMFSDIVTISTMGDFGRTPITVDNNASGLPSASNADNADNADNFSIGNSHTSFGNSNPSNATASATTTATQITRTTPTTTTTPTSPPTAASTTSASERRDKNSAEKPKPEPPPRKFYAIHIGPSKTGTSTIQADMRQNPFLPNSTFDKDHVIYVGKREGTGKSGWLDPNKKKEIRKVVAEDGNVISVRGIDEQVGYHAAVKCCGTILQEYFENSPDNRTAQDELLETNETVRASLREQFINDCWRKGTLHAKRQRNPTPIDFSYMLDYSLVDSNEGYSYVGGRGRKHSVDGFGYTFSGISETMGRQHFRVFDILGYEKLFVVGVYRRYAEWIVSAYGQSIKKSSLYPNRFHGQKKHRPCAGLQAFLNEHALKKGNSAFGSRFYNNLDQTLPVVIATGPSKLKAKTMNYFQLPHNSNSESNAERSGVKSYDTITTELYCDALEMPHSCQKNRELAKTRANVTNKGSTGDAVYQQIVATGYQLGYLLPNEKDLAALEKEKIDCLEKNNTWCESIHQCKKYEPSCAEAETEINTMRNKITSGSNTSIVGTNSSNITMYKDLSAYHETVHNLNWVDSLPYVCPKKQQLQKILEKSLRLEQLILPEFHSSPLGENEHKRMFWDVWFREKRIFCWVDIEKLFQNATTWDEIINHRMVSVDWGSSENN